MKKADYIEDAGREEQHGKAAEPAGMASATPDRTRHVQAANTWETFTATGQKHTLGQARQWASAHFPADMVQELEAHRFMLGQPFPTDPWPTTDEEWARMDRDADESGWVSEADMDKEFELWHDARQLHIVNLLHTRMDN